jgi:hypothetical protein
VAALPIRWIEAKVYCHATEDEGRVAAALDAACPGGAAGRTVTEGHFGNPIVQLVRRIEGAEAVRSAWARWAFAGIVSSIAAEAERRVDDGGILHVRLDKQAAAEGSLRLAGDADSIDVQVRLIAYPARPDTFRAAARALVREAT